MIKLETRRPRERAPSRLAISIVVFTLPALVCLSNCQAIAQSADVSKSNQYRKAYSSQGKDVARIHDKDFVVPTGKSNLSVPPKGKSEFVPEQASLQFPTQKPLPPFPAGPASKTNPNEDQPKGQLPNVAEESVDASAAENQPLPAASSLNGTQANDPTDHSNAAPQTGDEQPAGDESEQETSPTSVWSFQKLTDRKTLPSTIQMFVSVAAISLVPAILLMTTCFVRIVVVLGILRQAIGLQQLPPTQVTTALALMMTFLIMAPTWKQVKNEAIDPYSAEGSTMSWDEAWNAGVTPVKKFMWSQIRRAQNEKDFWVFYDYLPEEEKSKAPESYGEIPLKVMLPAFMISELKVAFLIGIQVLLPFLILDIVAASLCNTMGLIMLPPTVVSLPLKLLLFVMVDGWNLVVAMLLNSFVAL